jgi:hypothetical protein
MIVLLRIRFNDFTPALRAAGALTDYQVAAVRAKAF